MGELVPYLIIGLLVLGVASIEVRRYGENPKKWWKL